MHLTEAEQSTVHFDRTLRTVIVSSMMYPNGNSVDSPRCQWLYTLNTTGDAAATSDAEPAAAAASAVACSGVVWLTAERSDWRDRQLPPLLMPAVTHWSQHKGAPTTWSQRPQHIEPMLILCWPCVADGGSASNEHWFHVNIDLLLGQRRRRWTNIKSKLDHIVVSTGKIPPPLPFLSLSLRMNEYVPECPLH